MRYQIKHAIVQFAAATILEDVNFEIHDNEKIAVVGRNGCGKTTLLKLINGDIKMSNIDSDESCGIVTAGTQRIGLLRQVSFEDGEISVEDEIKKCFEAVFTCENRMREVETLIHERSLDGSEVDKSLVYEYESLQKQMEALRGYSWKQDMEMIFQKFGFALEDLKRPIGTFSGGQQTKVAFIKLLLARPDIMLLDEPTNHLDITTIEWLEDYLKKYDNAVVIVSHDRMFLDRVIDVTYEIEYGKIKRYKGNYSAFMRQKEENMLKQERDYEEQQKEIQRLTEWIEKWKNTPTKVAATRSKRMAIEHMVKVEKPRRFDTKAFKAMFTPLRESYSDVIIAKKLKIGYDEVLSEVSFELHKGERIAVIGENGKGKSTLLKTLVGMLPSLGGSFTIGTNVDMEYFDQQRAVLPVENPKQTVMENFWEEYPKLLREEVRSALGAFMFSGEEVEKEMGMLSGGEKVRLELCKIFYTKPNLLILDEPTNHMDIIGKEALEHMLGSFEGTVLFVSHDRYFISRIATGILEFGMDEVRQYTGTYNDYLIEKDKRAKGIIKDIARDASQSKGSDGTGKGSVISTGSGQRSAGSNAPTLDDVFDKKTYYNPGKIISRLKSQLEKYERQIAESETRAAEFKLQLMDPELAMDYHKLMEIQEKIDKEEHEQETLLERMLETELELEETVSKFEEK